MSLVRVSVERLQVDSVRSRTNSNNGEIEYQQKIWLHKSGSKFPTEYQIRLPSGLKFYEEGDYVMDIQANMMPDKYLGLSFNGFAPSKLTPVSQSFIDSFESMNKSIYDQLHNPQLSNVTSTVTAETPTDPVVTTGSLFQTSKRTGTG